jgi:hypothetical protein
VVVVAAVVRLPPLRRRRLRLTRPTVVRSHKRPADVADVAVVVVVAAARQRRQVLRQPRLVVVAAAVVSVSRR